MLIDPSQPIYFDTDSAPGRGIGYWQMNPRRMYFLDDGLGDSGASAAKDTVAGRIARRVVLTVVILGIPLAVLDMLLR